MMHTSYPYQTLTLGAFPRTQYPFQTLTLGATGVASGTFVVVYMLHGRPARVTRRRSYTEAHAVAQNWISNLRRGGAKEIGVYVASDGRLIEGWDTQEGWFNASQRRQAQAQLDTQFAPLGGLSGLGATGEAIDAVNPPVKGERMWYERQTQGHIAGAVVGAVGVAAWLMSRKAKRVDVQTRVMIGAAVPLALMFAGGYANTMRPRGVVTPA